MVTGGVAVVFDTCEDSGPILPALSTAATLYEYLVEGLSPVLE